MSIHPIVMDIHLPAGMAGPDPMDFDVRCFLVPHAGGFVLVDTGLPGSLAAIEAGLAEVGAGWSDVSDILISHDHPDHIGSLDDVTAKVPGATVWGNAPLSARALEDGETVRGLRVIATPGHTAGHVSLLHDSGALLVGDSLGNQTGQHLQRAPAPFTADAAEAERSLHRIAAVGADRLVFAHGPELDEPMAALRELLDGPTV